MSELRPDLARVRSRFPGQALFVTEMGAEANREGPASEKGTFAFQRDFLDAQLGAIDAAPKPAFETVRARFAATPPTR